MAGNFTLGGVRGGVGAASSLKVEDVEAIRKEVPNVQYIAPGVNTRAQVIAGNQNWSTRLEGTDVDFPLIRAVARQVRRVLQPAGRQRRREGGRARQDRQRAAVRPGRRSDRAR